ncbi:hypothetical protein SAMN04489743_2849 [Pseudarthrobacter equi]|uniref:Tape measure protein n=1 Tax=Pseudarthrobacter equi TaxID=728066 RepID=A0A1H2A8Y4_9MICC|nr:hypothetical protein [Pseudarthrobacter equi]SDT42343.1 hypothetical protein SAMN04489743_2849 [Pseudarthrobacter equi]
MAKKNLGADQVGMEIVLDEGNFDRDKEKLLAPLKKPVKVPVELDEEAARKAAAKQEAIQAERDRKAEQREAEAARKKAEREDAAAKIKAEKDAERDRIRAERDAEIARKKEERDNAAAAKEAERLRKESVSDLDKAFVSRNQSDVKKLAAKADALIPVGIDGDKLRAELAAKVAAATAALKADIPVEAAEVAEFRAGIATLVNEVESQVVDLQVEADTVAARLKLEAIERDRQLKLQVDVDTAAASAQMAAFRASQMAANAAAGLGSVMGNGGSGGFDPSKLFGRVGNIGGGGNGTGITSAVGMAGPYGAAAAAALGLAQAVGQVVAQTAGLSLVAGAVGLVGTAAGSSLAQVTSLAASVGTLAGTAALLPAVATGVLGIAGTALTIIDGLPDALTAMREAQKTVVAANPEIEASRAKRARETVVDAEKAAAKAQIAAIDAVADAREAANKANDNAVDSYRSAAKQADDAAKALILTQLDLTKVREDAAAALEKIGVQLERSAFNETKANKALKIARDNLAEASTNKRLMPEQLGAYKDAVTEAEIAAKEAAANHKQTQKDFTEADKVRIDGTGEIIAAKDRVNEAEERSIELAQRASAALAAIEATRLAGIENVEQVRIDSAERVNEAEKRADAAAEDFRIRGLEAADKQAAATSGLEDALNRISPAARRALTAVSSLMDEYRSRVGMPAQEEFFEGFEESLRNATDKLLPELETGLGRIAGTLGDATTTWFDEIAGSLDEGVLDRILDNLNTGLSNANAGIAPIVDAFTTMGETGSTFLPELGDGFADLAVRFNDFIQDAAASGELERWIEKGLDGIEDLGSIALNAAKAIDEIGKAADAADSLSLGSLADGVEGFSEWLADPSTQETMKTLFEGGKLFFDNLGTSLPVIGDVLAKNAPAMSELAGTFGEIGSEVLGTLAKLFGDPAVVEGAQKFADGLLGGLEALEPAIPGIAEFLGKFLEFLGVFSEEGGEGLADFIEWFAPMATDLVEGLTIVLPLLNDFLGFVSGMSSMDPETLGSLFGGVIDGAEGALNFLNGDFSGNWGDAWSGIFGQVSPPAMAGDFALWSQELLGGVDGVFGGFDFGATLDDAFRNYGNFWDDIFGDFDEGFADLLDGIVDSFRNGGVDALNALKDGLQGFNLGSAMDALNPMNVFNFQGGQGARMAPMSLASDRMFMAANAPTASDYSSYGGSRQSAASSAGAGKYYTIENLSMTAQNDLDEMLSGFFNRIEMGA